MTKSRKTTFDERVALVNECISNGYNYSVIAKNNEISYQLIYTWVKKFQDKGESALVDKRCHRASSKDQYNELMQLRTQLEEANETIALLRAEIESLKQD